MDCDRLKSGAPACEDNPATAAELFCCSAAPVVLIITCRAAALLLFIDPGCPTTRKWLLFCEDDAAPEDAYCTPRLLFLPLFWDSTAAR